MSDIIIAKITVTVNRYMFRINTVVVNSEVILDSHNLVASTLKE